jgi:ankyrin repeat protein
MSNTIIDLIKNKNIKELISLIKKDKNINLNVKDNNYNYFIYYALLYNEEELIQLILDRNVRLDILDTDGRNILYVPIKYSYNNVLKKILKSDNKNIGIPIIDIKDKLGLTALHYSIIFNNFEAFKILLENNSNILTNNNQNLNAFHICIQYNRLEFFVELINNINELDIYTSNSENLLQYAISYDRYDFFPIILKKKININNQENLNGLSILHQVIIKDQPDLIKILINYGANINSSDFYGNTPLHYAISEEKTDMLKILIEYKINFNLTNIDGNTPLHIYLSMINMEKDILQILIKNTDLNIQNNYGDTCLKKIVELYIFDNYSEILKTKELNFFILDNNNEDLSNSLNDKNILTVAIDSFYNILKEKKDDLVLDWEKWCSNNLIEKLKTLNINKTEPSHICKEKIKEVITKEKRSLPKFSNFDLVLDNGVFVNTCYYTGVPLDILFGLLYLNKIFSKDGLGLILDYPLSVNQPLESYYQKLGIDYPFKLEFSNCEILWSFQKIFYPSYFENEMEKKMKDNFYKYVAIPLGIELNNGSHANILLIDKKNKTIERFEPNGANSPIGLNYNSELLDDLLENKFSSYELKYVKPKDFLPTIGFQILENIDEAKCRRLGDPNGFCGIWCTWWVYHRMKNKNLSNVELAIHLIRTIKMENKNFKNLIRNFSYYVTDLRDTVLKKFNIDINDWMVSSVDSNIINNLEKEIFRLIS